MPFSSGPNYMEEPREYKLFGATVNLTIDLDLQPPEIRKKMDDDTGNPDHAYFQTPEGKLHYRFYLPDNYANNMRAVVVWQHGIAAHSGVVVKLADPKNSDSSSARYTNMGLFSRKLKENNIGLYAPDFLGHGYSEGKRFYIPKGDWRINRDHFESFARFVSKKHENVPLFLSGDSYGGCTVLHVARLWQDLNQYLNNKGSTVDAENDFSALENKESFPTLDPPPKEFKGIFLNAPAIEGDLPPWPVRAFLQHVLAPIIPESTPFFMPHPISPERIWRDEAVRKVSTSDEVKKLSLSSGAVPFRLGTALGLLNALFEVQSKVIPQFNVPFCVCHGSEDHGVPVSGTKYLVKHCDTSPEDYRVNIVEGAYHDLQGDPKREEVIDFHIDFIESRIK